MHTSNAFTSDFRYALAGMPSFTLTDLTSARLQAISFFLVLILGSAAIVGWIWNGLTREFPQLPRIGYLRSLGLVVLWGAMFMLVLTMISGARELMTPGAWEREGHTYRLKENGKDAEPTKAERREKLGMLWAALNAYARGHGGAYPADDRDPGVDSRAWESADITRARYVYVARAAVAGGDAIVAYERFGPTCTLILRRNGIIEETSKADLKRLLEAQGQP